MSTYGISGYRAVPDTSSIAGRLVLCEYFPLDSFSSLLSPLYTVPQCDLCGMPSGDTMGVT